MLLFRPSTEGAQNMVRSAASKVMWVGRATVFLVGLSMILALVFGVASMALGADGDFFKVGKSNLAASVSKLIKSGAGPALRLEVDSGPPLSVNSGAKVTNLNADKLDGQNSRAFFTGKTYDVTGHLQGSAALGVGTGRTCDEGDVPVGGGYSALSANEGSATEDRVYTNTETGRHGWYVAMEVPSPGTPTPYDFFVHVRCADLGTPHP